MHNLPVAVRIIGGYVIVVILAAAISITGISGIASMSASFDEVTERAMPMLDNSNLMVTHTLLAQRNLTSFEKSRDRQRLDEIQANFESLNRNNEQIASALKDLLKGSNDLLALFNDAEQAQQLFVASGVNLMQLHRQSLQKASVVSTQQGEFSDMGDETLSFMYDMEGDASEESTFDTLSDLETNVDNITASVIDAIRSGIKMAVLEARSELSGSFSDIESNIDRLSQSSDLGGNESLNGMRSAFERQSNAANALLNAYLEQLEAEQQVKGSFEEAQAATSQTVDLLSKLSDAVHEATDLTKTNTKTVISNSRATLLTFAVIALVASIVVALFITRSIKQPLTETVEMIKTIATGDLSHDIKVDRKDELGQLALSMQELVSQLRNMLGSINANSEQLASTAEQSSTISRTTFDNISTQKMQTDQMVTSVHEMTATVNEVSNSASQTLAEVESAHNEVSSGEEVLSRNIQRFKNLASDIRNAADVIQKLNDDCTNIGGVLDVIKGVAEQTNLLALNAAIEAARAGEQGRGFAVVADEVRTLASRAHDSTAEIEDMIARLQSRAKDAVTVMGKSQEEAERSVESISEAGTALQQVAGAITTIKDMSYQIASAAEQQAQASQSQLENITAIAEVAEDTANGAQENQSASEELARMAEVQRDLVGKFKL